MVVLGDSHRVMLSGYTRGVICRLRNYGTWFSSVVPVHSEVLTYRSDVAIVIESVFGEKGICQL